jgi:probable addiction module antidote protein
MASIKKSKNKVKIVSIDETLLSGLTNPREAAAYVAACTQERGAARLSSLLRALQDIAKAYGMSKLSRGSESRRRTLYKALSKDGNPRLETVESILNDLGLTIDVKPLKKAV